MNYSKKFLIFTFFLICFSIGLSSIYSNDKHNEKTFRYLEDADLESEEVKEPESGPYNCTENPDKCVFDHMECDDKNETCNCTKEYATIINDKDGKYCNVKRKKQLTAFLLELFVGFGAGHFYRKAYLMASLKLVAFVFGIYVICLFPLTAKLVTDCCDSDCLVVLVSIIFYLYAAGLASWYILDLVYFGKNKWPDCSHGDNNKIDFVHW